MHLIDTSSQPSGGAADPAFHHAQSLRSICTHLLQRFKHSPPAAHASQELQEQHQSPQEELAFQIRSPDNVLNLIWSLASLWAAHEVPFVEEQARSFLQVVLFSCCLEATATALLNRSSRIFSTISRTRATKVSCTHLCALSKSC